MKKLYRSREHRIIAGVCGGFAEYFDIDPIIIRIIFLFIILAVGWTVILYFIAWIAIPKKPLILSDYYKKDEIKDEK